MLSIQFSYQKSDMHAPLSRQRCGLVIFTAETACADIRYDESLYDGTRFTLLLHLTCWHMWASHTASIIVHALSINDAPGDARASQPPWCRRWRQWEAGVADEAKTGGVSKQFRQNGGDWYSHSSCCNGEMTMIEEAACVGPSGGCVAPYNSPGSNDPGRRQQHPQH